MDKQNNMSSAMDKTQYVTPQIEVIEVAVEKGFATSPDGVEGQGTDTNGDYDFGDCGANGRRGTWGNLWE